LEGTDYYDPEAPSRTSQALHTAVHGQAWPQLNHFLTAGNLTKQE